MDPFVDRDGDGNTTYDMHVAGIWDPSAMLVGLTSLLSETKASTDF